MSHHFSHPYIRRKEYSNLNHNPHNRHNHTYDAPLEEEPMVEPEESQLVGNSEEAPMNEPQETPQENPAAQSEAEEEFKKQLHEEKLRMAAEMENFKKRLAREHQEQMRYAAEKVLSDLLPALDNLDLAIQYGTNHEACANMLQGIEMTRNQLLDAVGKSGLVSLGNRGEEFDPALHEAIGIETDQELPKDAVSRVMQRGYKLNDRVLRPAKVMVNK